MSVDTVKIVAERFINSSKPEVLALKGSWGVGKTYTWNQIVNLHKNSTGLKYYCYVSLFGVSSISQLALSIFTNTRESKLIGTKLSLGLVNEHWFSLGKTAIKNLTSFARKADFPYSKNLSVGLDQLAPSMINDTIVCLDDFERSQLKAEEIMGFISNLKEERGCKVVLIFNEEQLKEKDGIYKKYREKVIDIELLFAPSPTEAIGWAFPTDMPCRELAEQCAMNLQIVNIRVLMKIVDMIKLIWPVLNNLHDGVKQQAVSTLVLMAWAYYDTSEDKPDLSFVRKWEGWASGSGEGNENNEDPRIKKWSAIIRNYGFTHIDEFDLAISKVIEHGYIEETGLSEQSAQLNANFEANDLENSFSKAWGLFHDIFSDNAEDLIAALRESFKKSYRQVSPMNLNSTVRLLRQLERGDIANEMIEYYIDKRSDQRELFDLENYPFSGDIDDTILIERFKQNFTAEQKIPTLLDAVLSIAKKHGWSPEEIQAVEQATEEDYYQLFLSSQGDNLTRVVRACLQFETIAGRQHLAEKPRAALKRIGHQSTLNALRVRKFGVTVEPTPTQNSEQPPNG